MNVSSAVIARAPSLDALKIYTFLLGRFEGSSGSIESTSYETLASWLDSAKLLTERGAAFTVAVVRKRLSQLERLGVVVVEKLKGAFFALTFRPLTPTDAPDEEAPRVDPYGGRTLFDSISDLTSETETTTSKTSQEKKYINNINKQTNKQTRRRAKQEQESNNGEEDDRPTPEDARAKVDTSSDAFKAFRSRAASILREPTLRSDLVDRLTVAVALRFFSPQDALALCRRAVDARELWTRSDGRRGVQWAWQDITPRVVEAYKNAGYRWTSTKPGIEPDAKRRASIKRYRLIDSAGRPVNENDEEDDA